MKCCSPKYVLLFLFSILFTSSILLAQKVSFYISAHQDDWQLFMGVNAYNDIAKSSDSARVVFIYVTAGDYSDCINVSNKVTLPYYLAREKGAKNSVQLAADSHKQRFIWESDTVSINHHLLIRFRYHYTTSYFLRLADGDMEGSRNISLKNFQQNNFKNNYSIDSLTSYCDWNDLSNTCEAILKHEVKNEDDVWVNMFDTNRIYNPGDHSDHYETSILFSDGFKNIKATKVVYEGYASARKHRDSNLKDVDIMKESGLFAAYNQAMIDNGYTSIWNNDYISFCNRNYFRTISNNQQLIILSKNFMIGLFILLVAVLSFFYYSVLKKK